LLRLALKRDAAFVYANPEYRLDAVESIMFKAVVRRRAAREPFQYIAGKQEFYGHEFFVTPDVLIPRPETEIMVEAAISELKHIDAPRFCEIGVGSGCISTAMLKNLPTATASGADISENALKVARTNAAKNEVSDRITFVVSDVFSNIDETGFDLILSNPPYVPSADMATLQDEVRNFEPKTALFGGDDGLDVIRRIISDVPKHLKPNGWLFMEIGWDQSERVSERFNKESWSEVDFLPDLQSIPRIVKARLK
jgi:release factor glutamine methyltransferase